MILATLVLLLVALFTMRKMLVKMSARLILSVKTLLMMVTLLMIIVTLSCC